MKILTCVGNKCHYKENCYLFYMAENRRMIPEGVEVRVLDHCINAKRFEKIPGGKSLEDLKDKGSILV